MGPLFRIGTHNILSISISPSQGDFVADPCNCEIFYQCRLLGGDDGWELVEGRCPPGTAFNEEYDVCDYPGSVEGCDGDRAAESRLLMASEV